MGTDARKLIADGYPLEQVVTSDLRQGGPFPPTWGHQQGPGVKTPLCLLCFCLLLLADFANLGHKLFKTTQETYPIAFIPGDVFDPNHLEIASPMAASAHWQASTGSESKAPDLRSLTSLNPLHGRVFAIHASSIFHLFGEEKQLHLARALAGLLSPEPGSTISGLHIGAPEKKGFERTIMHRDHHRMWCHSPESWTELWDGLVFEKGVVKVQTKLAHMERKILQPDAPQDAITFLVWSVTRL